jgi:predicted dithiol-disulfide oxidoreductase (DUF899 family)
MKIANRIQMLFSRNQARKPVHGLMLTPNETLICDSVDEALDERDKRIKELEERVATLVVVQRPI